jgi:hypothetical protein
LSHGTCYIRMYIKTAGVLRYTYTIIFITIFTIQHELYIYLPRHPAQGKFWVRTWKYVIRITATSLSTGIIMHLVSTVLPQFDKRKH